MEGLLKMVLSFMVFLVTIVMNLMEGACGTSGVSDHYDNRVPMCYLLCLLKKICCPRSPGSTTP